MMIALDFPGPHPKAIGRHLAKGLRIAREYVGSESREEVAKHLEIPRSALSNVEAGQRKLDTLEPNQAGKAVSMWPMTWITGEDDPVSADKDELAG